MTAGSLPALPPAYVDHLTRPRHVGDLDPADAAGVAGTALAGAGVRITLRYARRLFRRPRIAAAGFTCLGGPAAVAPCSWVAGRVVGATRAEAGALRVDDVVAGLAGPGGALPPRVTDATRLVLDALADALREREEPVGEDRGILVCRCFLVGDVPIRAAVRAGATDVPAVSDATSAGRGCHSCWPEIRALVDLERAPPAVLADDAPPLVRVAEAVVRPLWRAQGVRLGRVAVEGAVVRLEVAHVERGALLSPVGAVAAASRALRDVVSEALVVHPY